jgi:hypothetical protein
MGASVRKSLFMKRILFLLSCLLPVLTWSQGTDSLAKLLQGRMGCGIVSNVAPSVPQIRVRCGAATTLATEPLVLLDGILLTQGSLSTINPNTIEAITILKGDEAGVSFCSRDMHGVILITSKKSMIIIKDKETGQPISNASVRIKLKNRFLEMAADSNGVVNLSKENFNAIEQIEVSNIGYESVTQKADLMNSTVPTTIQLKRKNTRLDEVVIISYPSISYRTISCGNSVKYIKGYSASKSSIQHFPSNWAVYPNPVQKGGQLTIITKEPVDGEYQIFSTSGAIIQSGIFILSANQSLQIKTINYAAGNYVICLFDRSANKIFSQKFIVQ